MDANTNQCLKTLSNLTSILCKPTLSFPSLILYLPFLSLSFSRHHYFSTLSPSLFLFALPSLSPLSPSLSHTFHISLLFFPDMADPSHYSKQVHRHRGKTMSHQRRSSSQVAFTRRCSAPLMEVAKSSTPQSPLSATPTPTTQAKYVTCSLYSSLNLILCAPLSY